MLSLTQLICTEENSSVINVSPIIEIRVGTTKHAQFQTSRPSANVPKQVIQHGSADVFLHLRVLGNQRKHTTTKSCFWYIRIWKALPWYLWNSDNGSSFTTASYRFLFFFLKQLYLLCLFAFHKIHPHFQCTVWWVLVNLYSCATITKI